MRCHAVTKNWTRCKNDTEKGKLFCHIHKGWFLGAIITTTGFVVALCAGLSQIFGAQLPNPIATKIPLPISTETPTITLIYTSSPTEIISFATETSAPTDTPPLPTATFTVSPTLFVNPANGILFYDNFDSGLNSAWQLISGQPSIANGALTASKDTWLQLSDSSWKNYKIIIEMTGNDCWFSKSYNVIGVRGTTTNNMIAFKWANCENEWDVVSSGNWEQVPNSHFQGNIWGPVVYTIEVKDNQFAASVPDEFNTSIVLLNEDLQPGTIFLKLAPKTLIDSFKIIENP